MENNKSDAIIDSRMEETFRDKGLCEEAIRMAMDDLHAGVNKEIIDCYMSPHLNEEHRVVLAGALKQGLSLKCGQMITGLGKNQIGVIIKNLKERIPYSAVEEIIGHGASAHQLKKSFEEYKNEMINLARTVSKGATDDEKSDDKKADKEESAETKQAENTETTESNQEAAEPQQKSETTEKAPEPVPVPAQEPQSVPTQNVEVSTIQQTTEQQVTPAPVAQQVAVPQPEITAQPVAQPASAEPEKSGLSMNEIDRFSTLFTYAMKDIVMDMNDKNTAMLERVMKYSEDKTMTILDRYMKDAKAAPEPPEVETPKAPAPAIPVVHKQEELPGFTETPAEKKEASSIRAITSFPVLPSGIDGVMRMILMPDGTLFPVHIERTQKKKNKGILGFTGRLFGKESKQNALLQQLIDEKLNTDQINMIKRAVKSRLSDTEVKDLINCNLSATEMNGLIDVVIADRQARMGVM